MSTQRAALHARRRAGWFLWRSCLSKRRYRTDHAARTVAAQINRQQPDKVHSYFCEYCHGFHTGHPIRRES